MNHNLAEYHVAVNADIQDIDVIFVGEDDRIVSWLGGQGRRRDRPGRSGGGGVQCDLSSHRPAGSQHADDAGQGDGA